MLGVAGIISVAVIIIVIEAPYLKSTKSRKERWVFSILLLIGVGLSISLSLDFDVPSPMKGLTVILRPFSDEIFGWLK